MCGIIGYVGKNEATPILISGLKKLEYRGYDSSGIGLLTEAGKIVVRKSQGKIKNLEQLLKDKKTPLSNIGISHTRWATHGAPSQRNAHPHNSQSSRISLVHNGIIENYQEIKASLKKKGHKFISDTDTEVIAHLIESEYKKGTFLKAVIKSISQLRGAFALGIISQDDPDTLIAARVGSPLIIGVGKGENFIASDVPAILDRTKKVIYLKDGELAVIKKDSVDVRTFKGKKIKPTVDKVSFKMGTAEKEGYPHFMLKEIHEQPKVLKMMMSSRVKGNVVRLEGLGLTDKKIKEIKHIFVVACGTAYHAGLVGKYVIERLCRVPVSIEVSSEFRYRNPVIGKKTLIVSISQSGETADTLAAVKEAKKRGAYVVSICNAVGSSLARESHGVLYTHAGPEIGVASTKAYTAQLGMLYLMALKLGVVKGTLSLKERKKIIKDLKGVSSIFEKILKSKASIAKIARANSHFGCFLFLGRNINFPSALEGALKLKEISYIPAEGYAAGEMKHGPIALIDEYRAVVCVVPQSDTYEKMISNIQEIKSRRGKIIAVATDGDEVIKGHVSHVVYVPKTNNLLTPLVVALPLQLIAYYISVKRGCDVDQPRNLAKSVTVE